MSEPEETDIYGGLPDYDFDKKLQELEVSNKSLRKRVKELESSVQSLAKENVRLSLREKSLDRNVSALYATALAEIHEKSREIADLKRERDSILFRRNTRINEKLLALAHDDSSSSSRDRRAITNSRDLDSRQEAELNVSRTQPPRTREVLNLSRKEEEEGSLSGSRTRERSRERRGNIKSKNYENQQVEELNVSRTRSSRNKAVLNAKDSDEEDGSSSSSKTLRQLKEEREKSRERRDKSKEQKEKTREKRAKSRERRAKSRERIEKSKSKDFEIQPEEEELNVSGKSSRKKKELDVSRNEEKLSVFRTAFWKNKELNVSQKKDELNLSKKGGELNPSRNDEDHNVSRNNEELSVSRNEEDLNVTKGSSRGRALKSKIIEDKGETFSRDNEQTVEEPKKISNSKPAAVQTETAPADHNLDTSLESNSSSSKENVRESKLIRAERMHQKKVVSQGVPQMMLRKEIKKISPVKIFPVEEKHDDLLSSLLASEKERINGKSSAKKKKKKSLTSKSPVTPRPSLDSVTNGLLVEENSSPEFHGIPETPGKYLLQMLEASPTKVLAERKELESAVFSILPTPLKLMAKHPLLSPLHNTPVAPHKPPLDTKKTPEMPPEEFKSPSVKSTEVTVVGSGFPFKRKRVLKIKCSSINTSNSSKEETSFEAVPAKKPCPPPPDTQKQPPPPKERKSPIKKVPSPLKKLSTPQKVHVPGSASSTGRKSNDSGTSQDFRLHYTSDSEISRSPSPFMPQTAAAGIATSTPHPTKKKSKKKTNPVLSALTPNSKRRVIMSQVFGASPASEREYDLDLEVTDQMRNDLEDERRSPSPPEDPSFSRRSRVELDYKYTRVSPDRIKKYRVDKKRPSPPPPPPPARRKSPPAPPLSRIQGSEERRRIAAEKERRRSPVEKERRRSPVEKERRSPPEYRDKRKYVDERRRSPVERRRSPINRRRSPEERRRSPDERRRSPIERRKSPVERRRSPEVRRRSPDERDRRSPDERERKYRRSRSYERQMYTSSSRRSPEYSSSRRRSPPHARRSPSPYERRGRGDYSHSPPREEERRKYKRKEKSRSFSPKLNGSSRYREASPRRRSPVGRGLNDSIDLSRAERGGKRNVSYERREERIVEERRGSRRDEDSDDGRPRREAPIKDLRQIIKKSRSKVVQKPVEPPSDETSDQHGSEEGEIDSD